MSLYEILLFVHIMAAIVWVGGGFTMQIFAARAMRAPDAGRKASMVSDFSWVGQRVFTPASGVLFLFGIFLVLDGNWSFGDPWISAGILIWLVSLGIGIGFFRPQSERLAALMTAEGPGSPAVAQGMERILMVGRVDLALLVAAVFLMATKPGT